MISFLITQIKKLHQFLSENLFYPIALSTFLAAIFFVGRILWSNKIIFRFLVWNLFLAWLPYIFSLGVALLHKFRPKWWLALIIPGSLWLLFVPNAFYIVTDFIHLESSNTIPMWYDAGLLTISAWTGIFLAVASLHITQRVVQSYVGKVWGWIFALIVIGLSGYGVYLGRFLDWNSWDIISEPFEILAATLTPLIHPRSSKEIIVFIVMYTSLFLVTYLTFSWLLHLPHPSSTNKKSVTKHNLKL